MEEPRTATGLQHRGRSRSGRPSSARSRRPTRSQLTVRELELLTALAERHDRIVSREELYRDVWGEPYRKSDRSVDVYVGKLRQKLEQALPGRQFIHTHFGFGYRLVLGLSRPSHLFHKTGTAG